MPGVVYIQQGELYWIVDPLGAYSGTDPQDLLESCGLIPYFLAAQDERDARTQMVERYGFGDFPSVGGTLDSRGVYSYPEDPDLYPVMEVSLRGEVVRIYPYGFVSIVNDQGSYMTRMD